MDEYNQTPFYVHTRETERIRNIVSFLFPTKVTPMKASPIFFSYLTMGLASTLDSFVVPSHLNRHFLQRRNRDMEKQLSQDLAACLVLCSPAPYSAKDTVKKGGAPESV